MERDKIPDHYAANENIKGIAVQFSHERQKQQGIRNF
jgi:hypothetical protein